MEVGKYVISARKLKLTFRLISGIFIVLLSFSCYPMKMVDVSSKPAFSPAIGKSIRLIQDVWALGGSYDTPAHPPADFIDLVSDARNYQNRYVVSRRRIRRGTKFRIISAWIFESSLQRILGAKPEYRVKEIDSNQLADNVPILITLAGKSDDVNFGLDPNVFVPVH
jgi:hypothetical protein